MHESGRHEDGAVPQGFERPRLGKYETNVVHAIVADGLRLNAGVSQGVRPNHAG